MRACRPLLSKAAIKAEEAIVMNRSWDGKQCHVTAINACTDERSVMELKVAKGAGAGRENPPKMSRLPEQAIAGLRNALVSCSRPAKQLQNEADQLHKQLSQRRFPAAPREVQAARKKIEAKIRAKDETEGGLGPEYFNQKIQNAQQKYIYREVYKELKRTRYNWKPLDFANREEVAAYFLARFPAHVAEVTDVLFELKHLPAPKSILDFGSGTGATFWAARNVWGDDAVEEVCCVDTNDVINQFSMDVMRGEGDQTGLVARNVYFRRAPVPSKNKKYDLVVIHRTLIEIASHEARIDLIQSLWSRTNKYLVIIESELEDSFDAVLQARDFVLTNGVSLDAPAFREALTNAALMTPEIESVLSDKHMSFSEKYHLISEALPEGTVLDTVVEPGRVVAPCPHDQGCPKAALGPGKRHCKFFARWAEFRADGRTKSKNKDGVGDSAYSYVILAKGHRPQKPVPARVLEAKKVGGLMNVVLCTPFDGLQRVPISKRAKVLYQLAKKARPGQPFPLETKIVDSDSDLHVVRTMLDDFMENRN